ENACYLTSIGYLDENFYNKPRIPFDELIKNKDGIIITSGGYGGIISEAIREDKGRIKKIIKELTKKENEEALRIALESIKKMAGSSFSQPLVMDVVELFPLNEEEKSTLRNFCENEVHMNTFLKVLLNT